MLHVVIAGQIQTQVALGDVEQCVEAAAFTAIVLSKSALPTQRITFTVDRPFYFAITGYTGDLLFTGGKNPYRTAWLAITGNTHRNFVRRVRAAIDSVDPAIRCGFCCVMSNWSADGVSVEKVTKLLAGNTQPLLRTIGAPYWGQLKAWGNRLQHAVELTRMECAWIKDENIELIAEGDVYPRPGFDVSPERLAELAGSDNRMGEPLIVDIDAPCDKCAGGKGEGEPE